MGFGGLCVCIGFVLVITFVVFGCFAGCLVVMSLLVMGFRCGLVCVWDLWFGWVVGVV